MASKTTAFNICLGIIGGPSESVLVQDADTDNSPQAEWMRSLWNDSVDQAVIEVEPEEAKGYLPMSLTGDNPEKANFLYAYTKPVDCLVPIQFTSSTDRTADYAYTPSESYIFSDYDSDLLWCVKRISYENTMDYPMLLAKVIAGVMAIEIANIWKPEALSAATIYYNKALDNARGKTQKSQFREKQKLITDIS